MSARCNPGRLAAAHALVAADRGAHVEDVLARVAPADAADRALAWNLALGVLRHRPELDVRIMASARRAMRNLDPEVRAVLRAAVYELRFTRVPPHAAVDQAVEVARGLGVGHAAKFVNAVLRNLRDDVPPDATLGHPAWLLARWRARYGAAAEAWMRANNAPAELYVVAKEDPAGVARAFQHAGRVAEPVGAGVLRVAPGPVEAMPGFAEGRWWVMDPAAVAVADLVPDVDEVLDVCAAPGGKSFRLASRGMRVLATDTRDVRLQRVRDGAARLGLAVEVRVHDWTAGPLDRRFPAVLVDAPCTGLGTLRRHPDIRWHREEADIARMAATQRAILRHASCCVAPGGCLVYAVCSPEPEEGPEVAAALGWPIEATFDNAPSPDGRDVFWACRMRRPPGAAVG